MKSVLNLAWLAVGALPLGALAAGDLTSEIVPETEWVVRWQGKPICVYRFGPDLIKPYVRELCTLEGRNILRDAPSDHLHHHALMYGIRVNGVNFWEEAGHHGIQKPVETSERLRAEDQRGVPRQAVLRQRLAWIPATPNASALLEEQRTLRVTIDPDAREVALVWQSRFRPAAGVESVSLDGANYHGLGMRFLEDLDPQAQHWVGGEALDLSDSRQDVRPAPWGAVVFDSGQDPATVALAGSPLNRGAPAHFFSMRTPFAYLSATQNLDRAPLEYGAGDRWTVTHLVLLYPGVNPADFIAKRVARWAKNVSNSNTSITQ